MNKKYLTLLLLSTFLTSPLNTAFGQSSERTDDPLANVSAIDRFTYEYFAETAPVTLLDMLQRIPEAQQILAQEGGGNRGNNGKRGFGSGGDKFLINGKRLSGKANNISDTMARISAGNVEEIQLIRGNVEGLDVQSDGLVINVKLFAGVSDSTTFWSIGGVYYEGHDVSPTFTVSHSGSWDNLEYMFGVERKHWEFHFDRDEIYLDAEDEQTGTLFVQGMYPRPSTAFTTNLTYSFGDSSILRLNGLYEPRSENGEELRIQEGDGAFYRNTLKDANGSKWEVGGDYERSVGWFGRLKTLFVVNRDEYNELEERFDAPDAEFRYESLGKTIDRSEKILRSSFTKQIFSDQNLEVGGEAAFNTYDQRFDQLNYSDADTVSEILANDEVEISENRYEIFAIHNYTINDNITLQTSLTTEFSTITADTVLPNGDISRRQTSFTFPKPRINLRYELTSSDQIRLLAEKKVSQLNFQNFITRWDNGTQQLILGNTGIKPQEEWEFSAAIEHRFSDSLGSVELQFFHSNYKDFISAVDFSEYEDELGNQIDADVYFSLPPSDELRNATSFSAKSGNIDKATAYGVKVKSNLRLGFLGVPEAVLNVDYEFATKNTRDQFTGEWRRLDRRSDHTLRLGYRHDVTSWNFAYGVDGEFKSDYERFYINYYWDASPYAEVNAFIEQTVYAGIKARLEGNALTGKRQNSVRTNYNDHIRFDDISRVDVRDTRTAREIRFSLQGTF